MSKGTYQIVILGAGESGVGAALLCLDKGISVFVSDYGTIAEKYRKELEENGIPYEEGQHSESIILEAKEVVKSPGIPRTAGIIRAIEATGIPIISEIELAGRYTQSHIIGITGSNGKTTTTMWIHHILLKHFGEGQVELAGNVGFSLARQVVKGKQPAYFVVELSSFQLEDMHQFRVNTAVVMNITPDHMDRYDHSMQAYTEAKMRILQNQDQGDAFIYWAEDEHIQQYVHAHHPKPMQLLPFVTYTQMGAAADKSDDNILRLHFEDLRFELPIKQLALRGPHNLQNAMAAAIVALRLGVDPEKLAKGLKDFVNIPHRLEHIAVVDGVRYINDSKATNIQSTYYALRTMTTPYVLILGGQDKGNNYEEIADLITSGARALVLLTTNTEKILSTFQGKIPHIVHCLSMHDAVAQSRALAQAGDAVLLSPACASFDLFHGYEDRGDQFRKEVLQLLHP